MGRAGPLKAVQADSDQNNGFFHHLRAFDLFKPCPDQFIQTLASVAKLRTIRAGELILQAGQVNNSLFLLYSGQVEIQVDNEKVAVLSQPGDLIGEMSALTERKSVANVIALVEVKFIEIDVNELESHHQVDGEFGYNLYRALSYSLSEKIIQTNKKARQFEIANRALIESGQKLEEANRTLEAKVQERTHELRSANSELESRNSELIASHRKLEELYVTRDVTFKKLDELQSAHLKPLMESIQKLEVGAHASDKGRISAAREQLATTISLLQPFSNVYSTEQAIRNQRVLLAESDRKQQVISKLALGGSGVELDVVGTAEEALERINSGRKYNLAFISSQLASIIPEIHKRLPATKLVFLASCNVPAELPALREHASLITNIVSRHPEDRTFTVKNIGTTVTKLVSKDLFGMEKYLIWGVEIHSKPVVKSDDRRPLIEGMLADFGKLGIRSSILDRIASVTEELLMNAIYDAPVGSDGKSMYNHLPRTTAVELRKTEQAEIRYACDGMLAAVSVTDPFGAFPMKTLLNYLERNYAIASGNQVEIQEEGKGGAGRGLHLIIASSDLVVFNVHRGKRTEVIALFNLDPKTVIEDAKPSFHFFLQG